jgi:DNA polymerase-3 subunit alpha
MNHPVCGFEHLHRHTSFSLLDGFATVAEYAERMPQLNQKHLCVTDHGVMGAVPSQITECERHNLHPIFAMEAYVNDMQPEVQVRQESADFRKDLPEHLQKKFDKSCHLTILAATDEGYSNLVQVSSWGWIHGFYRKPRVTREVLKRHKKGLIFLSGCANSEIANALMNDGEDAAMDMVRLYQEMFSPNFRLEIMMLDFKGQKDYNSFLIKAHDKFGVPLVLTQDTHYCIGAHSLNQRLMLMQKNKRTIQEVEAMINAEEDAFELQDSNLWMKSEDELNEKWEKDYQDNIDYELFKQAKLNSVKIAKSCKGVQLNREIKFPKVDAPDMILWQETQKGLKARRCPDTEEYRNRIKEEYELISKKGFSSYFLIQKEMIDEARSAGKEILGFGDGSECVGPGRGSVCGSLVAYCLRLHDVEPIIHNLSFSRFLSPARGGLQMKVRFSGKPIK